MIIKRLVNGEEQSFELTGEEIRLAHETFVKSWMKDVFVSEFKYDDTDAEKAAEAAYCRYCEGNGETEYESIEAMLANFSPCAELEPIPTPVGIFSPYQYAKLAEFVRSKDSIDNFRNYIDYSIGNEADTCNIAEYLLNVDLPGNASAFKDYITDTISGETENEAISEVVKKLGGAARYTLISNKDTDAEQEDEAILMKCAAKYLLEHIRKRDNRSHSLPEGVKTIRDCYFGDEIDLTFVDEIKYRKDYQI